MFLTSFLAAFLLTSCAIPITRTDSFIAVRNEVGQDGCLGVGRVIRQIALGAGYAEIVVPPADYGRHRVLAIYGRHKHRIILYDWDGSCEVYADELEYVLQLLRSRGYDARIEVKSYTSMIELIPYAP